MRLQTLHQGFSLLLLLKEKTNTIYFFLLYHDTLALIRQCRKSVFNGPLNILKLPVRACKYGAAPDGQPAGPRLQAGGAWRYGRHGYGEGLKSTHRNTEF